MKLFSKGALGGEKRIQRKFDEYLDGLEGIGRGLRVALDSYLEDNGRQFETQLGEISSAESHLDEIRREIEMEIYGRRLLPDTRGDVLSLLENIDRIPNRIESIARSLKLQHVELPDLIRDDLTQLADHIIAAVQILTRITYAFLDRPTDVHDLVRELSKVEHEADQVEHHAVAAIFGCANRELAHKIQLEGLIQKLGSICDMAEDVGDRLMISSLKRVL
jgi:predicted phosphate transport protein (TIGR00153 family)